METFADLPTPRPRTAPRPSLREPGRETSAQIKAVPREGTGHVNCDPGNCKNALVCADNVRKNYFLYKQEKRKKN